MSVLGRLLFIIGLGGLLIGGFDVWLLLRGTAEPEVVSLTQLGATDGTGNVHLTITDFTFGEGMVLEATDEGRWKRVWIPLLTADGQWTPRPVVAHTNSVSSEAELDRLLESTQLTGVISNGMQGLGKNQQEQFAVSYPTADLSGALALQIGRRFPSPYIAYPIAIGGAIVFVLGLGMTFGFIGSRA